jgi:ABC-type iron transport system FetAB permease component
MTMVLKLLTQLARLARARLSIQGRGKHPDHWWDIEISTLVDRKDTLSDKDLGVAACQAVLMMQRIINEMKESGVPLGELPPD